MTGYVIGPPARPSQLRAHACLRTELVTDGSPAPWTRLAELRSQGPLKLRPTIRHRGEPWIGPEDRPARVSRAAGAAGPIGGDVLSLDIEVGAGSTLVLSDVSASLVLPGLDGALSQLRLNVRVEQGATLVWLPEPTIAARGCWHVNDVAIDLANGARLLMSERILLGRKDEPSGRLRQRLRVRRDDRPLLRQDLDLGGETGTSPAVVGSSRAVGSLLVVDDELKHPEPALLPGGGALLPLASAGAVLVNALAADSSDLRQQLNHALAVLGPPWNPSPPYQTDPHEEST